MSHLRIQRKFSTSPRTKLRSEQSREHYIKRSVGKIIHQSIGRRRFTTNDNSSKHQSHDFASEFEEAQQVYESKNTKKAYAMFRKLHKQHPTSPQLPYFLGSCLLNQTKYEPAINYFKISLQLNPLKDKNVYIYLAICYKALNNLTMAIHCLDEGTEKNPKFEEAYFYKGKIYSKMKKHYEAIENFKRCLILNPKNQLALILMADSLRCSGKHKSALEKYEKVVVMNSKQGERALFKKISLLIQVKSYEEARQTIEKGRKRKYSACQLNFYQGSIEFECENYAEAVVVLQLCLAESTQIGVALKTLKMLMKIAIIQKDFFGAEHLVNRFKKLQIEDEECLIMCTLIEGINDLIKRKFKDSSDKFQQVIQKTIKLSQASRYLLKMVNPYYAYCLFLAEKPKEALRVYKKIKNDGEAQILDLFNMQICEGILHHLKGCYDEAERNFKEAEVILPNKIQSIFLNCINLIQKMKKRSELKQDIRNKMDELLKKGQKVTPLNSLFLFYKSLYYLYEGKDARPIINLAIQKCDEKVSEYYFIQGLAYSVRGDAKKGLQSLNQAIQLDSQIPQFLKQRSKYYYVLEQYQNAIDDILKIGAQNDDQQASLLLTFYYYMTDQYHESFQILSHINNSTVTQSKFKNFKQALLFRMNLFEECKSVGALILAILRGQSVQSSVIKNVEVMIQQRSYYSQFTPYHYHLILASYFCYLGLYDDSVDHLFGCLEEIQSHFTSNQDYLGIEEILLLQVKFNIAIVNLCKDSQNSDNQKGLQDTLRYIQLFKNQTQNKDFLENMQIIQNLIKHPTQYKQTHEIYLNKQLNTISHLFPYIEIKLPGGKLQTKVTMLYPNKLKFNIIPEFDQSFLFHFDMEKVETKLCPPWFNLQKGQMLFTEEIRIQSVLISETEKSSTPLLLHQPPHKNTKARLQLDDEIEKKLANILNKKKLK